MPVQGQEQLSVRETRRKPVGCVHRERRLADARHAADGDHAGNRTAACGPEQAPQFRCPAREAGYISRERARYSSTLTSLAIAGAAITRVHPGEPAGQDFELVPRST